MAGAPWPGRTARPELICRPARHSRRGESQQRTAAPKQFLPTSRATDNDEAQAMNASKQRTRNNGTAPRAAGQPFDVVGIGFGPANLALALCLKEEPEALG